MMNPVPWLQMTNMISYQGLVRTFPSEWKSRNGSRPWPPSLDEPMALPLFCHGLGDDFSLEALLSIHLLEAAFFVLQLLETRHEGGIHPALFRAPLIEGGGADAVLAAEFRDGRAGLGLVENGDDLGIAKA